MALWPYGPMALWPYGPMALVSSEIPLPSSRGAIRCHWRRRSFQSQAQQGWPSPSSPQWQRFLGPPRTRLGGEKKLPKQNVCAYIYIYGDTLKSSMLIGFSIINHPAIGDPPKDQLSRTNKDSNKRNWKHSISLQKKQPKQRPYHIYDHMGVSENGNTHEITIS